MKKDTRFLIGTATFFQVLAWINAILGIIGAVLLMVHTVPVPDTDVFGYTSTHDTHPFIVLGLFVLLAVFLQGVVLYWMAAIGRVVAYQREDAVAGSLVPDAL